MTKKALSETRAMIANMNPVLQADHYVFCTTRDEALCEKVKLQALGVFQEAEGTSFILERSVAEAFGFATALSLRHIVLEVFSALEGIGLTAAVAAALATQAIPCNMVAAYHHDHVFIPAGQADQALQILKSLQIAAS